MELTCLRYIFTEESTISDLLIGDKFFCYILEDVVREPGVKIPGKTAIPEGRYKVIVDQSVRFKRAMPHILDVPMFEGVRIHAGNTAKDTEGCLITGYKKGENYVSESVHAFNDFFDWLYMTLRKEEVFITVKREVYDGT